MLSREEEAVRRLVTVVWNDLDAAVADQLVAEECPGLDGTGPAAVLAWHRARRAECPGLRYEVLDVVSEPGRAAFRWTAAGSAGSVPGAMAEGSSGPAGHVSADPARTALRDGLAGGSAPAPGASPAAGPPEGAVSPADRGNCPAHTGATFVRFDTQWRITDVWTVEGPPPDPPPRDRQ